MAILLSIAGWTAWATPLGNYYYDEKFSLANVKRLLDSGQSLPDWYYWYAPPSYVPETYVVRIAARVASATGRPEWAPYVKTGSLAWTRPGVFVMRCCGIVYAALALVAFSRVARRLVSPGGAALATFAVATTPWFLRVAAGFKPDPLLLWTAIACFGPLLAFVETDRPRSLVFASLWMGLATAAKLNGALLAVPVALVALTAAGRWTRRLALAAIAALTSVVTYLVLSPFPYQALRYLHKVERQYQIRGRGLDSWDMLASYLSELRQPRFLGWTLALAAIPGLLYVLGRSVRLGLGSPISRSWLAIVLFPIAQLAFLVKEGGYPKENHLFQLVPFLLLPIMALGERAASRLSRARLAATVGVLLWLVASATRTYGYVAQERAWRNAPAASGAGTSISPAERVEPSRATPQAQGESGIGRKSGRRQSRHERSGREGKKPFARNSRDTACPVRS